MIQKCLIRREKAKKKLAADGGFRRYRRRFFQVMYYLFSLLNYVLRLKPSLKITDYMKVAKLPPPPYFFCLKKLYL